MYSYFPGITLQVAKHHVHIKQEVDTPFESEVESTLPPEVEAPAVATMTITGAAPPGQEGEEDENGDQVFCQLT